MGARLDTVFVVDVEATCWKTREEQGTKPNEIIEIGICKLNIRSGAVTDAAGYVVKPRFTNVSAFCTELTGWTQADMDGGADIGPTIQQIGDEYGMTKDHIWFSCGEYDRVKLGSDGSGGSLFKLYGITRDNNPFAQMRHFNIKTLFGLKHKLSKEKGMDGMLAMLGEKLEGRHHNGADDAFNIAKIVRSVLK
jgi:inhibitor of KinA sporulation pathway (predicted exonuclease)